VNRRPRIVVIGGGMAGLGAAWELEKARRDGAAVDWMLFETDHRLGGKVLTERTDDGFVIEGGPDSFIVDKPWPMELARELGIGDRLLDSNETVRRSWVLSGGRLHELPEGLILMVPTRLLPFALSGLISWRGKLRMGMDLVLPRGKAIGDESLGDFVRRRLGREALAKVAEPLVAGIHAGDPEQMSLRATFPMFHEMEEKHRSLIVGMVKRRRARRAAPGAQARGAGGGGARAGGGGGGRGGAGGGGGGGGGGPPPPPPAAAPTSSPSPAAWPTSRTPWSRRCRSSACGPAWP
jgi:oxygen-dependent protoporphyrinogen oxidase